MKTGRILHYSIIVIACITLLPGTAKGQRYDKTFKWTYSANRDTKVVLDNYDTDLEIMTWDKKSVELHITVNADVRSEEDANKLDDYLGNLQFNSTGNLTSLDTRFWKSINNIMGFSTMKLINNEILRIKKINVECKLWIPKDASLELNSKYSEIKMEDIGGLLNAQLYDDDLFAGKVEGDASINARYSKMNFTDMNDIDADIYNCNFNTGNAGDITIISRYSDIHSGNVGIMDIESHEDDFIIENCSDIRYIAKYSEFTTGKAGKLVANNYECEFTAESITDARIESKYSEFSIDNAGNIEIISSYEDKLEAGFLGSLMVRETKYGEYDIEDLATVLDIQDAYEDKITVYRLGKSLRELNIGGKYLDIELGLASGFDCRLIAAIKYPDLDIDDDIFTTKIHIKEDSNLEYEGIKGTEKAGMPELNISGYEVNLSIREY